MINEKHLEVIPKVTLNVFFQKEMKNAVQKHFLMFCTKHFDEVNFSPYKNCVNEEILL